MTSDRTTRAKRALEQSEEMLGEVSVLTGRTVPERLAALVTDLARDVIELEAVDIALDGLAVMNARCAWFESVIAAGREMYERTCAEVAYQRDIIAAFQEHNNGAQPPLKTIELADECDQLRAEIERLRAELEAERELSLKRRDYLQHINRAIWPTADGLGDALRLQNHMHDVVRDMRAEIERLRSALELTRSVVGDLLRKGVIGVEVRYGLTGIMHAVRAALSAAERREGT